MQIKRLALLEKHANLERRFGGIARLYGEQDLTKFTQSHICVIGVGGVGSWAVEALARSGIGFITMIDLDHVSESNCNRQLSALDPHFGQAKVAVIEKRILAINPNCQVNAIEEFIDQNNLAQLLGNRFDYLIDAIDHTATKAVLATWCLKQKQPFIVCGGAGGRINPCRIKIDDLAFVKSDPLLAKLRHTLRRHQDFNQLTGKKFNISCVYSDELVRHPTQNCHTNTPITGLSCAGYGASMAVTASFGLIAAAVATNALASSCT